MPVNDKYRIWSWLKFKSKEDLKLALTKKKKFPPILEIKSLLKILMVKDDWRVQWCYYLSKYSENAERVYEHSNKIRE
jgi:hypothetical protein